MKKLIPRGSGFLRRSKMSRKAPNGILKQDPRPRIPALSDPVVGKV